MYQLTPDQVTFILDDIRRNGIGIEDLQLSLLDHICCIIEEEMQEGDDFELLYKQTIRKFYRKELKEIETETIHLLTFKNYYAMKKLMILSGAFCAGAFIIGSFFKIQHWPGTAVLLISAIVVFSLVFLPLVLLLKTREANNQRDKWVIGIATVAGILYCLSAIFLVQHWPGKQLIWFVTLSVTFFLLIPVYFFTGIRKPETKVNTIVTTVLLLGVLGIQFTLTALKPSPQTNGSVYTYLQSEQLLSLTRLKSNHQDGLAQDIQNICDQIKSQVLSQEMGIPAIPADFENKGIVIREKERSMFFLQGEGRKLLGALKEKVARYNAAKAEDPERIPIDNTILEPGFVRKDFCSNLFVLNNITQLQLFLAGSGNASVAAK